LDYELTRPKNSLWFLTNITLIGKYENADKKKVIGDLCDNYAIAVEDNGMINDFKVNNIKRAMRSLFVSILIFAFFAIGLAFS